MAVVDGGFQQDHPDLGFLSGGYNAYDDSYTLPVSNHGTHVSGILGAKGNNSIGITGINWDTDIFAVAGSSGSETIVLRAYNHLLGLRKQYNSSGGTSGRYIVATNSSFGVDEGDPANYPYWCAAYDSMGVHGILSVAATANLNIDVDTVGDVPTGCSSNYLISVTNTTHTDARNSGAAYGANSIDLGAPGTSILSTITSNNYASYTGTSMATPHVTGVIGLVYSILPSSTISNSLTNPSNLPLLVKDWILNNTDPISALSGITITGGRLNAFEAVKHALPIQYPSHFFAHSGTFSIGSAHIYGESYLEFGTLSIPSDVVSVIDGDFIGYGATWAKVQVNGRLLVTEGTSVSDMAFEIKSGGELIIAKDANLSGVPITVENGAHIEIRQGVTLNNSEITVNNGGHLLSNGTTSNKITFNGKGLV
ncbi:MAG: S8 family serine peptidase, partial [Balneolales bacterium]|nr:S8 family serine peptidase [Balneolales bacterium]